MTFPGPRGQGALEPGSEARATTPPGLGGNGVRCSRCGRRLGGLAGLTAVAGPEQVLWVSAPPEKAAQGRQRPGDCARGRG